MYMTERYLQTKKIPLQFRFSTYIQYVEFGEEDKTSTHIIIEQNSQRNKTL